MATAPASVIIDVGADPIALPRRRLHSAAEGVVHWIVAGIKWIILVSGALKSAMIYLADAAPAALFELPLMGARRSKGGLDA